MNVKITFVRADHFDLGAQNCGFDPQRDFIIVGNGYTFDDWLSDRNARFNQDPDDPDTYFILDDDLFTEARTGEAFRILNSEPTTDDLKG